MRVEQISIFLENTSGRLAEVTSLLAGAGINIRALSLADTAEFGVLRMLVNETERARQVLKAGGFTAGKTEVVAVAVPDRPGGLAEILRLLDGAAVNVEYMYAFVQHSGDNAIMIFRFEAPEQAIQTLTAAGVRVLTGDELHAL
jgi:hypothetical protein